MTKQPPLRLGFIGLGKLGGPVAEIFHNLSGHEVTGYDIRKTGPWSFKVAESIEELSLDKDVIFIFVQTPHDPLYDGSRPTSHLAPKDFDYQHVKNVLADLKKCVTDDTIVVLSSTVLPGTIKEQLSGEFRPKNFVYNPYLVAMGSIREDMVFPEMMIFGLKEFDDRIVQTMYRLYRPFVSCDKWVHCSFEEAECIKVFYNTAISLKIGLVNMIQDVAMRIGNINCQQVSGVLANSTRRLMSPAYMKPGMGDAGPCHPRDLIALRHLSEKLNLGYDLFGAIGQVRDTQAKNMAEYLESFGLPVAIIGVSYKPGVPYVDGSYSILVGSQIQTPVYYVDHSRDSNDFGKSRWTILLAHASYPDGFLAKVLAKLEEGSVVVDPWRSLDSDLLVEKKVRIIHYGNTAKWCKYAADTVEQREQLTQSSVDRDVPATP